MNQKLRSMYKYLVLFIVATIVNVSTAQSLKLEEIMKGDEYIGHQPTNHRWAIDSETLLFSWNPTNALTSDTYYWKEGMNKPMLLPKELKYLEEVPYDRDQSKENIIYFIKRGHIVGYNKRTKEMIKVHATADRISSLSRGLDPNILYFRKDNNIFSFHVKDASLIQMTNLIKGKKPTTTVEKPNFLKEQQEELFLYVKETKELKKWNENRAEEQKEFFPKAYYSEWNYTFVSPSPDGRFVLFGLSEPTNNKSTNVEAFVTEDGYTSQNGARSKVSVNSEYKTKLAFYDVAGDSIRAIDFSKLPGIKDIPAYYSDYPKLKDQEAKERNLRFFNPVFNKRGDIAIMDIRSQDNKDRWIVQLNYSDGSLKVLDRQHDDAWIGGPGIGGFRGTLGFLPDDETLYFQSEESGFSHLYSFNVASGVKKTLTSGKWEVRNAQLSNDGTGFYLTTNTNHPGNREFYKLDIASTQMTEVLAKNGAHEVELSPDETKLAVRYSYKNQPWELFIGANTTNPNLTKITSSISESFKKYAWKDPEVITFNAKDGQKVYARVYRPATKVKNKAAVIFVHGAGYLQNAHNHWSSYHREYMFHNLLVDKGYTVLDIDYRGSDGYGRDVRTGIYRHMGGLDLSDHMDGRQYLIEKHGIDPGRVGIYGGSYGGFITLMALLTEPGTFKAGAALRSVTDWAHYNHGYTSNILNYPETDTIAYEKSSPIYFAQNLKDNLLMLHGMVDDNVQFQDIVRLTQRFIELGKKNWDLAVFPVEAHGFVKTYSWVDEYRRILDLFDEKLLRASVKK